MAEHGKAGTKSLFFRSILLADGWSRNVRLTISDGLVSGIQAHASPAEEDERHGCALPGVANLHSHAFQRGMAGLAETRAPSGDSFWTWREIMYRFLDRMTPDHLEAIAALAYMEMLESGFTRVGEFHYLHHDRGGVPFSDLARMSSAIAAAAAQSGIGLTLLPVLYSHAGFGAQPPRPEQARFTLDLDRYARLIEGAQQAVAPLPDAIVGVAPHSLRAVSEAQLAALAPLAKGRPVHIHIAEQTREVEDCLAWSGQRPVAWLLDHAEVDARWCLVHATHMTEGETTAMARSGAIAGLCPITEANLGDGFFPIDSFLAAGGHYGVGSDSNVLIGCAEELRLLEYGQRLLYRGRNRLATGAGRSTGADMHAAAVYGGAAALGVTGGIAIGQPADIVSLDPDHPSLIGREGDAIIDSFIFASGRPAIDCVWRYGEKLVCAGRHRSRTQVIRAYHAALETLIA